MVSAQLFQEPFNFLQLLFCKMASSEFLKFFFVSLARFFSSRSIILFLSILPSLDFAICNTFKNFVISNGDCSYHQECLAPPTAILQVSFVPSLRRKLVVSSLNGEISNPDGSKCGIRRFKNGLVEQNSMISTIFRCLQRQRLLSLLIFSAIMTKEAACKKDGSS